MSNLKENVLAALRLCYHCPSIEEATKRELYGAISSAAIECAYDTAALRDPIMKRACYFSAEFLLGRLFFDNLSNLGLLDEAEELLGQAGLTLRDFEDIEDAALGNGGLGRLAACFLDSAATHSIPLDGYGLRYRYGLFKQSFDHGFQKESTDDWHSFCDPWSVRREDRSVSVHFADYDVVAVPYDTPVIGYGGKCVNKLTLWQSEAVDQFNFDRFNSGDFMGAVEARDKAEMISAVLYPNDSTDEGRKLRLRQQYFFSSASLRDIIANYKAVHGDNFDKLSECVAIQLNDTHPVVAIPELLRILIDEEELFFEQAFTICQRVFAYTNHTVMAEALEKWDSKLFCELLPHVYDFVVLIDRRLREELRSQGVSSTRMKKYLIINDGQINMANMAVYCSHSTNGVAQIHSELLKKDVLSQWYALCPERFNNKTNGITQRRWLKLSNPELSSFISGRIGSHWITNLNELKKLESYTADEQSLRSFADIKRKNKERLCEYLKRTRNIDLDPSFIFDIQVKRMHEYKRQLLNAFSIVDIYFRIKSGELKNFTPTAFIFGGKAASGYFRAKGVIKYINEISSMIESDEAVSKLLKVVFVPDYNVSAAEYIIPAADISEQISTAGTEASGTGNMKFMLNGAVTLGTYDGANIEIVEQAGRENNYIFGARVEELERISKSYDPFKFYNSNPRIKKVIDTLIDGTFSDGGNGMFRELYNSLLFGASWHKADHYYLLYDLEDYVATKLKVIEDYSNRYEFAKKGLMNTANAGKFSSDRTILQYSSEIWKL